MAYKYVRTVECSSTQG